MNHTRINAPVIISSRLSLQAWKPISVFRWMTVVFSFLLLFGCKSAKEVVKPASTSDVKKIGHYLFQNGDFQTLESKVEFRFSPKEGVGAGMKGTIKMRRDSCLLFSVQPFAGIEAVKCLINKDSMVLVSRLHQVYAVEDLRQFDYKEYLNLEALQAILSNRMFVPGDKAPDERKISRFERHDNKEGYFFRWAEDAFILDFMVNKDNQYCMLKAHRPEKNQTVVVSYNLFQDELFGSFPHQFVFSTEGFSKTWQIQITYLRPIFDSTTDFRFEVPSRYKKVTTTELIQRFQNML
jgi:hypothetical protein